MSNLSLGIIIAILGMLVGFFILSIPSMRETRIVECVDGNNNLILNLPDDIVCEKVFVKYPLLMIFPVLIMIIGLIIGARK